MKLQKFDSITVGVITGMLLPWLGMFIVYFILIADRQNFNSYLDMLVLNKTVQSGVLSLSLIPNMICFYFIFFRIKMNRAAQGMVLMTLIYGILIVLLKTI